MKLFTQALLFIGAFILIYYAMNAYALSKLLFLVGFSKPPFFIPLVLLMAISLPLAMMVEKKFPNLLTRSLYFLSTLWLGILAIFIPLYLIFQLGHFIAKAPLLSSAPIILLLTGAIASISIINASLLGIKQMTIILPNLKNDMRIVQLSDLHIGTIRNGRYLKRVVRKVNALRPNAVVITGDLIDGTAPLHPRFFAPLNDIAQPVYYVTGNHEYYEGVHEVYSMLKKTNLIILKDEMKEHKGVQFIGIQYSQRNNHLKKILKKISFKKRCPSILLHHVPHHIPDVEKAGIGLMLSGHTHNGQIFPFTLFAKMAYPYLHGLYRFKSLTLYVSPGTGTWGPYMRLGSKNEITVIDLKKNSKNTNL